MDFETCGDIANWLCVFAYHVYIVYWRDWLRRRRGVKGLLQKILKRGVTGEKYIYWKGKYFNSPESFKKEFGANFNAPCVLV